MDAGLALAALLQVGVQPGADLLVNLVRLRADTPDHLLKLALHVAVQRVVFVPQHGASLLHVLERRDDVLDVRHICRATSVFLRQTVQAIQARQLHGLRLGVNFAQPGQERIDTFLQLAQDVVQQCVHDGRHVLVVRHQLYGRLQRTQTQRQHLLKRIEHVTVQKRVCLAQHILEIVVKVVFGRNRREFVGGGSGGR